jgi:hypothetical protein
MAVFSPIITQNVSSPPLVVTVADPGVPGVTYDQVKNSLGQYVYLLQGFYVQSTTLNQLIGAIKYLRYDADGNQLVTNITTTVDPYQDQNAIIVDLVNFENDVIFNGNSSIQFTVLPFEQMQLKLYMRRITSSFGRNLKNFLVQEKIAHKPHFFDNYGNLFRIAQDNWLAQQSATLGVGDQAVKEHRKAVNKTGDELAISADVSSGSVSFSGSSSVSKRKNNFIDKSPNYGLAFIVIAAASFVGYVSQKDK